MLRDRRRGRAALLVAMTAGRHGVGPEGRAASCRHVHPDSPASMSIHEEATVVGRAADDGGVQQPRHVRPARASRTASQSIVPDLATGWSWNEDGTELTFRCARASNGTTASRSPPQDVKCTWDLLTGKVDEQAARQSAQILVPQPRPR